MPTSADPRCPGRGRARAGRGHASSSQPPRAPHEGRTPSAGPCGERDPSAAAGRARKGRSIRRDRLAWITGRSRIASGRGSRLHRLTRVARRRRVSLRDRGWLHRLTRIPRRRGITLGDRIRLYRLTRIPGLGGLLPLACPSAPVLLAFPLRSVLPTLGLRLVCTRSLTTDDRRRATCTCSHRRQDGRQQQRPPRPSHPLYCTHGVPPGKYPHRQAPAGLQHLPQGAKRQTRGRHAQRSDASQRSWLVCCAARPSGRGAPAAPQAADTPLLRP